MFRQHAAVPVTGPNGNMDLAWSGGVNHPHFAMADLNKDGRKDLVIFRKSYTDSADFYFKGSERLLL